VVVHLAPPVIQRKSKERTMAILNPYLGFRGQAREALDFYRSVFGGEVTSSTLGEAQATQDPAEKDWIMHGQLETPSGFTLMVSDTPGHMDYNPGDNFSVSLSGPASDEAELKGYWATLLDGGSEFVPLLPAPWGDQFGMLTDRFGVRWLVNIAGS
jgi:PhnB protein